MFGLMEVEKDSEEKPEFTTRLLLNLKNSNGGLMMDLLLNRLLPMIQKFILNLSLYSKIHSEKELA
jgi:hypothetical protein